MITIMNTNIVKIMMIKIIILTIIKLFDDNNNDEKSYD